MAIALRASYQTEFSVHKINPTQVVPPGQIPLKVPIVELNFDVSVDNIQLLTDTSKSNSTLWLKL